MAARPNLPPVLVVDDDADALVLIKRLLSKAGVRNPVVTFNEASQAVAFLNAACGTADSGLIPWIIFTDLRMPGMSGLEFAEWVREQKRLSQVPVVMLSSSTQEKDMKRATEVGIDRYLIKLPTPEVVAKILAAWG